jgi:hypothetical protein
MPYITQSDVATLLQVTLTAPQQAAVNAIIAGVEKAAETYCNRTWGTTSEQTEYFDGGKGVYFPAKSPIASIASIKIDGDAVDADEIYNYGSYVRLGYHAARGYRNVEVKYTPAEALPADVKHALVRWTAELFKSADQGGKDVKRVQIGDAEIEYQAQTPTTLPPFVEQVLSKYRLSPV